MDNPQGSVDVPLSLFGGVTLELAPPDIPEGLSPDCQDVIFLPGDVGSRPGMHRRLLSATFGGATLLYQKTYVQPNGNPQNLYLTSDGWLWMEDLVASPGSAVQIYRVNPGSKAISVTFDDYEFLAFNDGIHGSDVPVKWDGQNITRVTHDGPGVNCVIADSGTAGQITIGFHQYVTLFQSKSGYITQASPILGWSAAGSKKANVTFIPIGPPDTVARIIAFTGSGGGNFFYIPTTPTVGGSVVGTSTVILDNTTTTATFDFADNTLFDATAIDIPGNNLFACQVLPQCLGVFAYSGRLMYYGMDNNVSNFVNMGFDGGQYSGILSPPAGWNADTAGSLLVVSPDGGYMVRLTSNGTTPWAVTSQTAYQDVNLVPIIKSNTTYYAKFRAKCLAPTTGTLEIDINSFSLGVLSFGTLNLATVQSYFKTFIVPLSYIGNNPIPSDARLRILLNGVPNNGSVDVDDLEIVYAASPYIDNRMWCSYFLASEQFDTLTGQLGPVTDPSPITACSILKDTLRIKTTQGIHTANDNGTTEPKWWTVNTFSRSVGVLSVHGGDPGMFGSGDTAEDWDLTASRGGMYLDFAGDLYKVSQEIQTLWDSINWPYADTIWIKNDIVARRVYIGLPVGAATSPNKLAVMDYRELDAAFQVSTAAPVHISFTGKMISSDLTRKWNVWNIEAACGEILLQANSGRQFCVGYGDNSYYFDPAKLTDDDRGQIFPYYTTYAFLNHEAEVALGTGVHRKLYRYLTMFASGVGTLSLTPLADSLSNAWPSTLGFPLQIGAYYDIENGLNVTCERCFFKIASTPIQATISAVTAVNKVKVDNANQFSVGDAISFTTTLGGPSQGTATILSVDVNASTLTLTGMPLATAPGWWIVLPSWPDNSFKLNKLVASIQADPFAPVRGAW